MIRILIVEDEIIIGLDLAEQLTEAGFIVVGIATTANQGLDMLRREGCDAAVLDVNLGDHTSQPVAEQLKVDQVPFVVLTGYTTGQAPEAYNSAPMLPKPIRMDQLLAELRKCTKAGSSGAATPEI